MKYHFKLTMAAENLAKDEVDQLSDNFPNLALNDKNEDPVEKDVLAIISGALGDIFNTWECNADKCDQYLKEMRDIYVGGLDKMNERPDFRDKSKQWCYMYLFMLNHSYLLFYSIKRAVEDNFIKINPNGSPLNVCAIGGGPGSDILGLYLLLNEKNCVKPWIRHVDVLDKFVEWEESWKQINEHLPDHLKESIGDVTYSQFDFVTEALDKSNQEKIEAAHVVTMTKVLSSAAAWLKDMQPNPKGSSEKTERNAVSSILDHMRNGAILLYLDNNVGSLNNIIRDKASHLGFTVLREITLKKEDVTVPKYFQYIDTELRRKLKTWNPSRGAHNETFIILQKPGKLSEKVNIEANLVSPDQKRQDQGHTL